MIMRLRELIIALKNEGKQLSYGREIKYHRSTAKYPVLDRNMVSGGFAPHMCIPLNTYSVLIPKIIHNYN